MIDPKECGARDWVVSPDTLCHAVHESVMIHRQFWTLPSFVGEHRSKMPARGMCFPVPMSLVAEQMSLCV